MGVRASQQTSVAELAQRALEGADIDGLMNEAAAAVARELEVEHVALLELTGDGRGLLARAGVGLPEGVLGGVLPPGPGDPPGPSPLGKDLGAAGSLCAAIHTRGRRAGWLEAHSRVAREFTADDDAFLEAM